MNNDQRRLINMYINQYNQANAQIDRLYGVLDEIRYNISLITQQQQPRTQQQQQQQQQHRTQQSTRNREHILYDWQSPINPSLYVTRPLSRMRNNNRNTNSSNISDLLSSFLNSTVSVRPSAEQLETASRLVRYGDITSPLSESCPISMDNFSIDDQVRQIRHCGHIFMPSEFDEWFQSNVRCPVCRYDIRNYTPTTRATGTTGTTETSGATGATGTIDPSGNEIVYDISNNEISDRIINSLTSRMIDSIFNPLSNLNSNDRFVFDPSNNILMYETIIPNPNSSGQNPNPN